MKNEIIVKNKTYEILIFTERLWKKIEAYVKANYTEYCVEIEHKNGFALLRDFEKSYGLICEHTDSIICIKICAQMEGQSLIVCMQNYRTINRLYSFCVTANLKSSAQKREMKKFADSITKRARIFDYLIILPFILCSNAFFTLVMDTFILPVYNSMHLSEFWFISIGLALNIIIVPLLIFVGAKYNQKLFGKRRIQFWTNLKRLKDYSRERTQNRILLLSLFVIVILLYVILYFTENYYFGDYIKWVLNII